MGKKLWARAVEGVMIKKKKRAWGGPACMRFLMGGRLKMQSAASVQSFGGFGEQKHSLLEAVAGRS